MARRMMLLALTVLLLSTAGGGASTLLSHSCYAPMRHAQGGVRRGGYRGPRLMGTLALRGGCADRGRSPGGVSGSTNQAVANAAVEAQNADAITELEDMIEQVHSPSCAHDPLSRSCSPAHMSPLLIIWQACVRRGQRGKPIHSCS